jgi:GDP-L-fucose synthase
VLYDFKGKTVWVAGETGMVGRAMLRALKGQEVDIISAPHCDLDLTNQAQTYDWLAEHKPDVVVMAAAKVGGIGANAADPASFLQQNLAMTQNVIHGAYLAGVEKLLYLGSSCIYPRETTQPITEDALLSAPLEPTNEGYALAKITGVKMCQHYRAQYGRDFISAMPCNLYGEYDYFDAEKSHVIPAMILKFHQAKVSGADHVRLWGTGKPLREFLYVDDLAQGLVHLLQHYSDGKTINIGSGQEISIYDLAYKIKNVVGFEGDIIFDSAKPDGTPRKLLDNSRINALGWQAETSLDKGIQQAYEWYLSCAEQAFAA